MARIVVSFEAGSLVWGFSAGGPTGLGHHWAVLHGLHASRLRLFPTALGSVHHSHHPVHTLHHVHHALHRPLRLIRPLRFPGSLP